MHERSRQHGGNGVPRAVVPCLHVRLGIERRRPRLVVALDKVRPVGDSAALAIVARPSAHVVRPAAVDGLALEKVLRRWLLGPALHHYDDEHLVAAGARTAKLRGLTFFPDET